MLGHQNFRLPWEVDDDAAGAGSVAPGKQTLTARIPPRIGGLVDPTVAAAPGLAPIKGQGSKPSPPPDDAFAVHLEAKPATGTSPGTGAGDAAAAPTAAETAADQAAALRQLLRADARFIAGYADALDVTSQLKIAPAAAALVLSRFEVWSKLGQLAQLVAEVRKQSVSGVVPSLLASDNAWDYLCAVLDKPARVRLYDLLADGNADARNTGRFTEDVVEFWDTQMRQDAGVVTSAYRTLADDDSGPATIATQRARIIATLAEYRTLDERYGMKGTLLSRFLQKIDVTVTLPGGLFGIGEQQTRMLDDIKRRMGPSLPTYLAQLEASNLVGVKGDAPELLTLGGSIAQDVEDAVLELEVVGDVVDFLRTAGKETAEDCIRWLARTPSKLPLLLDFIAEQFQNEKLVGHVAYGLSLLSAETIVEILQKIDVERLGRFYLALVACSAGVLFLPQLFAAYWLLPDKTRDRVFSALGRTAFKPLVDEAKEFVVPILQDLIDRHLPVGVGVYAERGLTASVSYAVAGGDSSFSITRTGPGTLKYDERFTLRGGVEYSRGKGVTEGKKDNEETQKFWAHEAAVTLGGKMELTSQNQYEFPFLDDDAFVGLLCAFIDIEAAVSVGALVFDELAAIDPFPYLKKSKLEPKLSGEAQGVAQSGMREGKGGKDGVHDWEGFDKKKEMGSSVGGPFGAQASATISSLLELGGSLELERDGTTDDGRSKHEVSVQVGLRRALTAGTNLPGLSALAAAVPATDTGVAVKATWTIAGLVEDAPEQVGKVALSLVGTTGDMEATNAGSETEVQLPDGLDLDSVDRFVESLGGATFKRRIGIASGIGRKVFSAIDNQKNLSAMVKKEYKEAGIKLKGAVDLEFELDAEVVQELAGLFVEILRGAASASFDDVKRAVMTFVTTGTLPDAVQSAGKRVSAALEAGLDKVTYRIEAGLSGAGGHVVGGVGGHGYAGAGLIFEGDVTDEIEALTADQLLDLVGGALDTAATVLEP